MDAFPADPRDVDATIQTIRFELYRENVFGALELAEAAHAKHPDTRYAEQAARIRSWLGHLASRDAYVAAQEAQYRRLRWSASLKWLERRLRMLSGRKTRKMIARRARDPEFVELEREVTEARARRVLDAGSGEGGVAMALAARHPELRVEGVEVAATNVRIASLLARRVPNAGFRQGLAEEVHLAFPAGTFDLAYSFAVLEHVRDVDATLDSILSVLRPGGRVCFVVPMHEFRVVAPIPEYAPTHGYADHCRVFSEEELRRRWGAREGFRLVKIPGVIKADEHGEFPPCLEPIEFGSFFVAWTK